MNYIKLLNRLWAAQRNHMISSAQAHLYYTLVQECNERRWQNPFYIKNGSLTSRMNISESGLIKARNKLVEIGLVKCTPGVANAQPPLYFIPDDDSLAGEPFCSTVYPTVYLAENGKQGNSIGSKQNQTKTFALSSEQRSAGDQKILDESPKLFDGPPGDLPKKEKGCAEKEKELEDRPVPHWRTIVSRWYSFCLEKLHLRVSFKGRDPKCLRDIMLRLEKSCVPEWTEVQALKSFENFLRSAWTDQFLQKKFLLINLQSQYDAIIANQRTGAFLQERTKAKPMPEAPRPAARRATQFSEAPSISLSPAPVRETTDNDWREMIESDYQYWLAGRANLIFLAAEKYKFLLRTEMIEISPDRWKDVCDEARTRCKSAETPEIEQEAKRLLYLEHLRDAERLGLTSIFSQQTMPNHGKEPGGPGKAAFANDQSALQGVCQPVA